MTKDTPDEKRKRQNRESQRRYRQRHKREPIRHMSDATSSSQDMTSTQSFLQTPVSRTGAFSNQYDSYAYEQANYKPSAQQGDSALSFEAIEWYDGDTNDPWDSWLRATSLCSQSFPHESMDIVNQLAVPLPTNSATIENGAGGIHSNHSHFATEDGDYLQSILLSSATQGLSRANRMTPSISTTASNRDSRKMERGSLSQGSSSGGSQGKRHSGSSDSGGLRKVGHELAASKVKSRAEKMISEVEKLYDFGVSIGILPEDREMQLALRRLKLCFRSLLPLSETSLDSSSDSLRDESEETSESA